MGAGGTNTRNDSVRRNVRIPATQKPPRCPDICADTASVADESTACSSVRSGSTVGSGAGSATINEPGPPVAENEFAAKEATIAKKINRWAWPDEVVMSGVVVRSSSRTLDSPAPDSVCHSSRLVQQR